MTSFLISKVKSLTLDTLMKNIIRNAFIPVSSLFFFFSNLGWPGYFFISVPVAFLFVLIISFICPPFSSFFARAGRRVKIISALSSIGISYNIFCVFKNTGFIGMDNSLFIRIICMVLSVPFLFVCNLLFWESFTRVIKSIVRSSAVTKAEYIVYAVLFAVFAVFVTVCFTHSNAFYGTENPYDVIYTSDSLSIVSYNAYNVICHMENDFRQPLFAVFAAPLMGIPGLIGNLLSFIFPVFSEALLLQISQIALLIFTAFMIAVMMELNPVQRICFVVVSSFTYPFMLFSVMMEQYIVATFWLVLTIYMFKSEKDITVFCSYAACGSMIISGALVPFILWPGKTEDRSLRSYFKRILLFASDFLLLLFTFGRTDVFINLGKSISRYSEFAGESVSLAERGLQYINLAGSILFAPASSEFYGNGYPSWQLMNVQSVNVAGIIILVAAVSGFAVTRKDKLSKISFGWICLSSVVLMLVGWGTNENGLILYSLYFGWPFLVLIFKLFKVTEDRLKTRFVFVGASVFLGICLLIRNIPSVIQMLQFAIEKYPI